MTRTGRNLTRYHGDLDTLIGKSVCNAQFNAEVPDGAYIKEVSSPDTVYIAWKDDEGGFGNVGNRGLAEVGFSDPSDELTDMVMELVDYCGAHPRAKADPRAWAHLSVYSENA